MFLPFVMLLALFIMAAIFRFDIFFMINAIVLMALGIFLIPPRFTFHIDAYSDKITFIIFFTVALLNGILTARLREQEKRAVFREKQANALFLLTKRLYRATNITEVIAASLESIKKYFLGNSFFLFRDKDYQLTNQKYIPIGLTLSQSNMDAATWAFQHDRATGRFTEISPSDEYTYYPLKGSTIKMGVVALKQDKPFGGKMANFWDAFLAQIAQSLEHQYLGQLAYKTTLLNESDKLYKTLFNSISHELRIPVASIIGASDILLASDHPNSVKVELYEEILNASQRLNRLIENLLNMSRLDSGRITVCTDWCDVHDLFNRVAESLSEELRSFRLDMVIPASVPLIRIDFGLMERVLYNLVHNACQYATPGTTIRIKSLYDNCRLMTQVTDRGPGFDLDALPCIFDKFWRPENSEPGGLGLGLSIAKGFVEAHNGTISVENRKYGGVRFTISIPVEISNEN